jgi:hypothetical protein
MPLPAANLRSNLGTWAVPSSRLPFIGSVMGESLPRESFDPDFSGQKLETTYFDTPDFTLRKARAKGDKYLTLRVRCYEAGESADGGDTYALSAKTETEKYRVEIPSELAEGLIANGVATETLGDTLPANLMARLLELVADSSLQAVVTICFRRYAVEDEVDRFTLDCGIETDTGKCYPSNVLEYKSTVSTGTPIVQGVTEGLRPIKLSKFLWSTPP